VFWAMWCKPCTDQLDNMYDHYDDWEKATGVKIITVATDDVRFSSKLESFVRDRGWDYDVYRDEKGVFKNALVVKSMPRTFLLNGKKEIVWQNTSYVSKDLHEISDKLIGRDKNKYLKF